MKLFQDIYHLESYRDDSLKIENVFLLFHMFIKVKVELCDYQVIQVFLFKDSVHKQTWQTYSVSLLEILPLD